MTKYQEGLQLMEERCANKDNAITLATISKDLGENGSPMPVARDVDAYYEDGVFYVVTYGKSTKMQQIEQNCNVAFTVNLEWISGNAIGENLGWVMKPENAQLRTTLRKVFSEWYDFANNENDENCCILAIRITNAVVIKNHGEKVYHMDFVNGIETTEGVVE